MKKKRTRVSLLAAAAAAYVMAAWSVAPGFYDGIGPAQPYNWTCPPPQAGPNTKPGSGHLMIKVVNGRSDPDAAVTDDGQIVVGFMPGAFDVTGASSIAVDIKPLETCLQPAGLRFVTNVYEVTADAPLVMSSNVTMAYSTLYPVPDDIYRSDAPNGPWRSIGHNYQAAPYTIGTHSDKLGYFAAGYKASTTPPGSFGIGLPIVVAVLIVVVLLAGLPLSVIRRRRGGAAEEEEEDDA